MDDLFGGLRPAGAEGKPARAEAPAGRHPTDILLGMLERSMPEPLKKMELRILMILTASAAGRRPPSLRGKNAAESLALYRTFTASAASVKGNEIRSFRAAMYRKAYRVGRLLALIPGMGDSERKKRLIILLYRNIEIYLQSEAEGAGLRDSATTAEDPVLQDCGYGDGRAASSPASAAEKGPETGQEKAAVWRIRIPRCSFSSAYTPRTCCVMSGLDAGIICGVFGGGRLSFDERITEGCPACRAVHRLN